MAKLIAGLGKTPKRRQAKSAVRTESIAVKSAKGRKNASTRWLQRQLNDPYVQQAKQQGWRSRAAFKLLQINQQIELFAKAGTIVDLGAAPGGWMQAARQLADESAVIVGCDLLDIAPVAGTEFICGDFTDAAVRQRITEAVHRHKIDLLLSDMSPNTIGHKQTDVVRLDMLLESSFQFALDHLKPGGHFLAKTRQSGAEHALLTRIKKHFAATKHIKPDASRIETSEFYLVAYDFTG